MSKENVIVIPSDARDTASFVRVEIPAKDTVFDWDYPTIRINHYEFEAGKTYLTSPELASEVRRIMKGYDLSQLKLLQPKKDFSALQTLRHHAGHQGQDFTPAT